MAEDRGKWGSGRRSPADRLVVRRVNIRLIQPIPTNFRIGTSGQATGATLGGGPRFTGSDRKKPGGTRVIQP